MTFFCWCHFVLPLHCYRKETFPLLRHTRKQKTKVLHTSLTKNAASICGESSGKLAVLDISTIRYPQSAVCAHACVCVRMWILKCKMTPTPPCRLYSTLFLPLPEFSLFSELTDVWLQQTAAISLKGNRHQERKGPKALKGMEIYTERKSAYQPDPFQSNKTGIFRRGATSGRSHFFEPSVSCSTTP